MTDHVPINPCTIPQFTGDLDALEQDHAAITAAAGTFRTAGENVDSEFQGLSAFYAAPEAAQLFATTKPVKTDSDFFADQLESAAKALSEYVTEARPIVARLKALQAKATTFTNKIAGDEHWKDDGKKIDENNDLIHDVNAAAEAFWAAERTCANKIRALYCAPPLTVNDGSNGANMYGYKADDLNKVQDLPWGSQLEETHRAWEVGYWVKSFVWDGIIVDGIWGTIRGLGTLVGVDGWDKAGQAWTGLAKLATGLAITTIPGVGTAFWMADDKQLPSWFRDSRTAMKETGKALVAWDEWGKNPARAAGAVTFNVLTTVFTGGAGTAAKTGGIAKVLSVAGKAGKIIDPITYIGKAGSLAKLKIGELFSNLGKVDGAFPKIDDVVWKDLPKADAPGIKFPHPDDTVRLPDDALGRPQYFDKTTNQLLDHKGLPKQDLTSVPKGPDHPLAEVPKRQEVTVGGPARQVDVTSHTPGGVTSHTPGGTASHTPGGTADNLPHNSHTEPGGTNTTPGHGNTDTTPTGGGHGDTPSTGSHGDGPSTGGGGHGDGPTVPHQGDGPGGGSLPDGPTGGADDGVLPGKSEPRPDGGRYIEEPDHAPTARFYDQVRANPETLDIHAISENTGIRPEVLDRVRTHFFRTEHLVAEGPGIARNGYFTPRKDIAEIWQAAGQRSLTPEEATKFERYIGHEYVESHLIESGIPYLRDAPHLWDEFRNDGGELEYWHEFPNRPEDAGAHDLALNERKGGFNHWGTAGFDVPKIELASDLSNIDEVVAALKEELRSKGIELK
ncbi:hypothetical protein [Streptomyces lavendulae]|uniref:hypothetical protein n=1 Tax=Streptomyces lavendulae TaxID=1914 RepID=UPI0024A2ED8C|nr:hypothetical protein [Streptomyces lavendulae]GLX20587.1 hypothetical protein Slala01_42310 [Streptomyces lavendulae subsp. lavendulae]GLX28251.1 hypothetical protein Slala02_40710 [Streptomyces lavendulae subsp. lavendulae]